MNQRLFVAYVCLAIALTGHVLAEELQQPSGTYDPLTLSSGAATEQKDLMLKDSQREREVPIRVYLPSASDPAPVVLFSHGLGGSREGCGYLGKHWSGRGYVVLFMQHRGTDESVWKGVPLRKRMAALKEAISATGTIDRFNDVKFVLDELERLNKEEGNPLAGRLDLQQVGMSGHSYGASTTQGVSGQSAPLIRQRYTDRRIDAAVMFSPNSTVRGSVERAFGSVSIPWMLMTGTKDTSVVSDTTVEDRRKVYPALPKAIDKYELVLHEAEHMAFSDGPVRGRGKRNPNHHKVILALSTAFWDSYLRNDAAAKNWLQSEEAKSVMEKQDFWQINVAEVQPESAL